MFLSTVREYSRWCSHSVAADLPWGGVTVRGWEAKAERIDGALGCPPPVLSC